MDRKVRELIESLHASERMVSMAIAGAGDAGGRVDSGRGGRVEDGFGHPDSIRVIGGGRLHRIRAGAVRVVGDIAVAGAGGVFSSGQSAERSRSGCGCGLHGDDSH